MKIRARLFLMLLLVAILPLSIMAVLSYLTIINVQNLAVRRNELALSQVGEEMVRSKAKAVAEQIQLYLDLNPDLDFTNILALQSRTELVRIAVQIVGDNGYTSVFGADGLVIFHPDRTLVGRDMSTQGNALEEFRDIFNKGMLGQGAEGYYDWKDADGTNQRKFMVIVPVRNTSLRVAATIPQSEFIIPGESLQTDMGQIVQTGQNQILLIAALAALLILAGGWFFGSSLSQPVQQLSKMVSKVMLGQFSDLRPSLRHDELGDLDRAMQVMTRRLKMSLENLEQQVQERTAALSRRSSQLKIAAQVAQQAASIRNPENLLKQTVRLISEEFGFYHAGIFLVDDQREYAILQAASSEGGKRMLARGHKLRIGETGIVGFVAATGSARIALDVGNDAVYFNNPDLPETHSEMGVPMRIGAQTIGVLDVQSTQTSAFSPEDAEIIQTMADQIALAIENARLLEESHQALRELNAVYGQQMRQSWTQYLSDHPLAFSYNRLGIQPIEETEATTTRVPRQARSFTTEGTYQLEVPIAMGDLHLGAVTLRRERIQSPWSDDELHMVQEAIVQIMSAIENARLLEENQQRAYQERTVGEIISKVQASLDLDVVLKRAVEEIGLAISAEKVHLRLGSASFSENPEPPADHPRGNGKHTGGRPS